MSAAQVSISFAPVTAFEATRARTCPLMRTRYARSTTTSYRQTGAGLKALPVHTTQEMCLEAEGCTFTLCVFERAGSGATNIIVWDKRGMLPSTKFIDSAASKRHVNRYGTQRSLSGQRCMLEPTSCILRRAPSHQLFQHFDRNYCHLAANCAMMRARGAR
ncbi:hypothetical protein DFH09DRAFT_1402583 [Mycena vulgaris]|nr:hypothetical protein DFH09DRAFT_1402583 [Mycena vulgaris]